MSSAFKGIFLAVVAVVGLVCGFTGSKTYAGIPVEITFYWSQPMEDVSGALIDEPLYYVLYANLGSGYFPVTKTSELTYTYISADAAVGCFTVYVEACYLASDLCSTPSEEVEKCIDIESADSQDGEGDSGETLDDVGEVTDLLSPPMPPTFSVSIQNY